MHGKLRPAQTLDGKRVDLEHWLVRQYIDKHHPGRRGSYGAARANRVSVQVPPPASTRMSEPGSVAPTDLRLSVHEIITRWGSIEGLHAAIDRAFLR